MKYWKVVRRYNHRGITGLYSCVVFGKARVEYSTEHYASPPEWLARHGYKLTVFDSFQAAERFLTIEGWYNCVELWSVEVINPTRVCKLPAEIAPLALGTLDVWLPRGDRWPWHTVFADGVKLVERLATVDHGKITF